MNTFHRCLITYRFFFNRPSYYIYISCPALTQKIKKNIFFTGQRCWGEFSSPVKVYFLYKSGEQVFFAENENFGYCFVSDSMCCFSSRKTNDWYCAISYILCCVLSGGQRAKIQFPNRADFIFWNWCECRTNHFANSGLFISVKLKQQTSESKKWYSYTISIPFCFLACLLCVIVLTVFFSLFS